MMGSVAENSVRSPPPCGEEGLGVGIPQGERELDDDRLREECGVFGIFGHPDAAAVTALGLHALQHRGQEAAGIVTFDGKRFHSERRMGLVGDVLASDYRRPSSFRRRSLGCGWSRPKK
jgi:hypothetical protein